MTEPRRSARGLTRRSGRITRSQSHPSSCSLRPFRRARFASLDGGRVRSRRSYATKLVQASADRLTGNRSCYAALARRNGNRRERLAETPNVWLYWHAGDGDDSDRIEPRRRFDRKKWDDAPMSAGPTTTGLVSRLEGGGARGSFASPCNWAMLLLLTPTSM